MSVAGDRDEARHLQRGERVGQEGEEEQAEVRRGRRVRLKTVTGRRVCAKMRSRENEGAKTSPSDVNIVSCIL